MDADDIEKKPTTKAKKVIEKPLSEEKSVDVLEEEIQPAKTKKAREYVLTPARAAALERMKAARAAKCSQINETKTKQKELVNVLLKENEEQKEEPKKVKKSKKQVIVLDDDSSSEEENQIVIRRKRAKAKPEVVTKEVFQEPIPFLLRRLR